MPAKKPRTSNDVFCTYALYAALEAFAKLKTLSWDWEGGEYAKSRRSQGADREGLEAYFELLKAILTLAPGGFPSLMLLKVVWSRLQAEHTIMAEEVKKKYKRASGLDEWATDACNKIRIMCSHVVDLKKSRTSFLSPKLEELVALVKLSSHTSSAGDSEAPAASIPATQVAAKASGANKRKLRGEGSDASSVIITSMECRCPACMAEAGPIVLDTSPCKSSPKKKKAVEVEASSDAESSTSRAARSNEKEPAEEEAEEEEEGAKEEDINKKPAEAAVAMKAMKVCKVMKAMKAKAPKAPIEGPLTVTLQKRDTPKRQESIVNVNGKYLAQCSKLQSPKYKAIMLQIKEELENGALKPEGEAIRTRIKALF